VRDASHRRHDRRGNNVLGCNQLQIVALTLQLLVHCRADIRISLGNETNGVHHITVHAFKPFPERF
jgi:hypothetical protein